MEKSYFIMSASVLLGSGLFIMGLGYFDTPSASAVTTITATTTQTNTAEITPELTRDTQQETAEVSDADAKTQTEPEKKVQKPTPALRESRTQSVAHDPRPSRLIIPEIDLNDTVIDVGVNEKGEMDVPSGKTKTVGWYKDGTVPGEVGSAVFDAHVFAAFKRLNELQSGDDVYVLTKDNEKLHFRVTDRHVYPLAAVPPDLLFERHDARRLNLITCAGQLTKDHSTYDHRLIVYTTLVDD